MPFPVAELIFTALPKLVNHRGAAIVSARYRALDDQICWVKVDTDMLWCKVSNEAQLEGLTLKDVAEMRFDDRLSSANDYDYPKLRVFFRLILEPPFANGDFQFFLMSAKCVSDGDEPHRYP
jgi:hypothetical protein